MPDNTDEALDLLPYVDLARWHIPTLDRSANTRGASTQEGLWRARMLLAIITEQRRAQGGWARLSSRALADAAGCTQRKALELRHDLWKRQRVVDFLEGSGRCPDRYAVTDPADPDHWRGVPLRPGWRRSRPVVPRFDPQIAARQPVVPRFDPLIAAQELSSAAICLPNRGTTNLDDPDSLHASKALIPLSNSLQSGERPEVEGERERIEADTEKLRALIASRRVPPWPVFGAPLDRLRDLVAAGHPVDAMAARICQHPPGEGPPLVLAALEANGYAGASDTARAVKCPAGCADRKAFPIDEAERHCAVPAFCALRPLISVTPKGDDAA